MPGACSLAVHICLRQATCDFSLIEVDYASRRLSGGADYRTINPKGYVPALLIEDAWLLTEVPAILQYLDDRVPEAGLLPRRDARLRFEALEWLSFVSSEVHKSFSPLFRSGTPKEFRAAGIAHLAGRLSNLERHLSRSRFLLGETCCAVDAYVFTVFRWLADLDEPLEAWPALRRHAGALQDRPAVREALAAEGLQTLT